MKKFISVLILLWGLVACINRPPQLEAPISEATMPVQRMTQTATATHTTIPPTLTPLPSATLTPQPTPLPSSIPNPPATFAPVGIGTPIHQPDVVIAPENVDQLTEFAQWGRGVINDVAYSGNGRWVAVGTANGVYIHDAQNLNITPLFFKTDNSVRVVDISFNGDFLAIGFGFHTKSMELWRIVDRQLLWVKSEETVFALHFSPDSQVIATASNSGVIVWDVANGEVVFSEERAFGSQFSSDGSRLAIWSYGTLSVYSWPNKELLNETEPILYTITTDGEIEAEGTVISDVQFTANNIPILLNLPGNIGYGTTGRVEFQRGSDNNLLLSLPPIEPLARPINAACDEPIFFADPPARPQVWQFEFLPESQIVALKYVGIGFPGDYKSYTSVQFYQLEGGHQLYVQEGVVDLAFSADSQTWVSGLQDGRLQIRRITDGEVLQTFDGYESPILDMKVSPDSKLVAVEYLDEIKLYRVADGSILQRYPAGRIVFSPDGSRVALGYANGQIEIREIANNSLINVLSADTEAITALTFVPSGDKVISATVDCRLNVWQLPEGTLIGPLENHFMEHRFNTEELLPVRVWDLFVTSNGQWLIGQFLSSVGIWNLENRAFHWSSATEELIEGMAFSPFGNYLAISTYPTLFWQITDHGEVEEIWQGGSGAMVAISPDGQLLVEGADENFVEAKMNGYLELLDANGGEPLHILTPSTRKVTALSFAPNGHFFVSASLDGIIHLWGVPCKTSSDCSLQP